MKNDKTFSPQEVEAQAYRVAQLIAGYIRDQLTAEEHRELDSWVTASLENQRLFEELTDPAAAERWQAWAQQLPTDAALEDLKSRLKEPSTQRLAGRQKWQRYGMAAAAVVLVCVGLIWMAAHRHSKGTGTLVQSVKNGNDLPPGSRRATVTLADGTSKVLDSISGGKVIAQGGASLSKDSGVLVYQPGNAAATTEPVYNTLTVPRGGEYEVRLPDGTRVKLNAESWLKYPTTFTGQQREVELGGEGYFDVAADARHPFVVHAGRVGVAVLGTQFNVNSYAENGVCEVTLAQGAVRVGTSMLRPGQQAQVAAGGQVQVVPANLETVLAWTRDEFNFREASLQTVMDQLARWYNVGVQYEGSVTQHFNATIPRSVSLRKVLHLLEQTGHVRFEIQPDKLIVRPS